MSLQSTSALLLDPDASLERRQTPQAHADIRALLIRLGVIAEPRIHVRKAAPVVPRPRARVPKPASKVGGPRRGQLRASTS